MKYLIKLILAANTPLVGLFYYLYSRSFIDIPVPHLTTAIIITIFCSIIFIGLISKDFIGLISSLSKDLNREMEKLNYISLQINDFNHEISVSSSSQGDASQSCVAALEETNSMVANTLEYVKDIQNKVQTVFEKNIEGVQKMDHLVSTMATIEKSNSNLEEMNQIIENIKNKTNMVNDIVFKTQILSFNASIEAERAGQHGLGFAVVAKEIGSLASVSGKAAQDIDSLLKDSKVAVERIIGQNNASVIEGNKVAKNASEIFLEIEDQMEVIKNQVEKVNDAAREQNLGIKQFGQSLTLLDNNIIKNSDLTKKAEAYSFNLNNASESIKLRFQDFRRGTVGLTFRGEIENIIDYSGRLRMLTQKICKELLLVTANISYTKNKKELNSTISLFKKIIDGISYGDRNLNLIPSKDREILGQLSIVNNLWGSMYALLEQIKNNFENRNVLIKILNMSTPLVQELNKLVKLYEDYPKKNFFAKSNEAETYGTTLNLAGRQRMLAQKMTKEILQVAIGVNSNQGRSELRKSINLFHSTLQGLEKGDQSLGLLPANTTELKVAIDKTKQCWSKFKGYLEQSILERSIEEDIIQKISKDNLTLLKLSNEIVLLYKLSQV